MAVVTEPCTRAEIEEAIRHHRETLRRMPNHWTDRRASIHNTLNDLLTLWQTAT